MRLFSYKQTHDTGFAPNPFGLTLTLATCKPLIRKHKHVGDWIAGFTSIELSGTAVGEERLIYLMRVGEKLAIADYFHDPRFADKIPQLGRRGAEYKAGDNIYRPLGPGAVLPEQFEQLENPNHWAGNGPSQFDLLRDLSGRSVLIADEFYYFGRNAIALPFDVRPAVPRGQSGAGKLSSEALAQRCVDYIRKHYKPGRHGVPHQWPEDTNSCGIKSCSAAKPVSPQKPRASRATCGSS
ncbi:hypothetical protein PVT68_10475 [Microbulbifer bruguierae]|uniref:Nucleotide modification associated domain-containing protein n=1 Tax=Microbulbifer bruguierae TaxID=3029061 RepID=A0ABY8N9U6_9GAMM|nr:hypothetical protein [Microbulbifer bruguierae]WGL15199.1 hypothetical protein PVT68_10475 [Microbulbifer bruguierae]